jgi:hypothetical protein
MCRNFQIIDASTRSMLASRSAPAEVEAAAVRPPIQTTRMPPPS